MNGAVFSDDRVYRYRLERQWALGGACAFIMLNPSTADEEQDDPTIRRCIRYAKDWGYGSLIVVNLFALRSTDPKVLYKHANPVGPLNVQHIVQAVEDARLTICAWGAHGKLHSQGNYVRRTLDKLLLDTYYLRLTGAGQPSHPLYLPAALTPQEWPLVLP